MAMTVNDSETTLLIIFVCLYDIMTEIDIALQVQLCSHSNKEKPFP